jgi:hypothetical protein
MINYSPIANEQHGISMKAADYGTGQAIDSDVAIKPARSG